MADTLKQAAPTDDLLEGEGAEASSGAQPALTDPGAESPAAADSADPADAGSADPADAKTDEPSAVPKPEPILGGPQAWRRDNGLLLAQTHPYVGGHWSVPWSDLMMVMFVLFAVLVAVQMRENRELVESAELEEPVPLSVPEPVPTPTPMLTPTPTLTPPLVPSFEPLMRVNVFERSQDAVRDARIENVEIVLLSDRSVKVSVQGPMFFELGEATLRSEVREFLDRLARVIGQTAFAVRVIGHTDDYSVDTEVFPSNWELSAARAARVARYLINSADIDPRRFTVIGRGEYEPAVPNTDDANRALNRRVEIIITRDEIEPASPPESDPEPESAPEPEPEPQGSESTLLELPAPAGPRLPQVGERAGEIEASVSNAGGLIDSPPAANGLSDELDELDGDRSNRSNAGMPSTEMRP